MPNYVRTVLDIGGIVLGNEVFKDGLLTFGGAGTVLAGTILAVDTSTKKFVPYVKGGVANGNGVPCAVVLEDVVATGAGDVAVRPLVSGVVNFSRLIINADGTNVNIDALVELALRDAGIVPDQVKQLAGVDN